MPDYDYDYDGPGALVSVSVVVIGFSKAAASSALKDEHVAVPLFTVPPSPELSTRSG
jgi:hypothetical protein